MSDFPTKLPDSNQPLEETDTAACVSEGAIGSSGRGITRRSMIIGSAVCGIGLIGAGVGYRFRGDLGSMLRRWAANNSPDSSSDDQEEKNRRPYNPIPNTVAVKDYRAFLEKHPVQYLSADELLWPHFKTRGGVQSGIPPKQLWSNMLATRRVADEVRRRLGVPLHTITSAYRSPQYNAKCPGASKYSQHMRNCALDLVYSCPPREAFEAADQLRKEGFFKGGIGLYKNFIHIDTRGRNATWGV